MKSAIAFVTMLLAAGAAHAVPSFARQTGLDCNTCHLSWLELAPQGRQFKLAGYTWGKPVPQTGPLAGMVEVSWTGTRKRGEDDAAFAKDRQVVVQEAAAFVAGRLGDHAGVFSEFTYEGIEHKAVVDNVDIRLANQWGEGLRSIVYGVTVNNNPTVQDVFNTGPAWGFPFASSEVAVAPSASTLIEGLGQQVGGVGAYALLFKTLYAEASWYRTADKGFSVLRAGLDKDERLALKGWNPYWRLALQREWEGAHSAMVGAYGMTVDLYPSSLDPRGPTERFRDVAFDAQYQYIGPTDHRFSAQVNYIRETRRTEADTERARSLRGKLTYYYRGECGINAGFFDVRDPVSRGYVLELNYLPRRDIRLVLQYTGYSRFDGARTNYDGSGRNARDNDSLYLLAWLLF